MAACGIAVLVKSGRSLGGLRLNIVLFPRRCTRLDYECFAGHAWWQDTDESNLVSTAICNMLDFASTWLLRHVEIGTSSVMYESGCVP